ncbi:hypothetical protein BDZ97DRAFT_1916427 [Flammula alnicola]|nr:hypothetical protein BDZ97DRAFT_1916427 [Flammula alnicola]
MPVPVSAHPSFTYLPANNHLHLFPQNPYPHNTPQPSIAHRVWILDCKACGIFLTNRGMKAVLLLRPNVSLYSSDALPVNCSAHNSNPDALRPPISHKPNTSPIPPRTCECLTQSLCCHGCGNTIGYMIVIPCSRCTSSISATNRATNGHRFVFHSNEVVGTERHYIHDEPGVIPFDPPLVVSPPVLQYVEYPAPPFSPHSSQSPNQRESSPVFRADYLPTPPLEFATPIMPPRGTNLLTRTRPLYYYRVHSSSRSPPLPRPVQSQRYASSSPTSSDEYSTPFSSPPPLFSPDFYAADHKEPPLTLPSLKPGDVIFWHHLSRSGEIPGVTDDERARRPASPKRSKRMQFNR